jgi:hypothetical protein
MLPLRALTNREPSERIRGRRICGSLRAVEGFFPSVKKIGRGYCGKVVGDKFFFNLTKIKDWKIVSKTLGNVYRGLRVLKVHLAPIDYPTC